MNCVRTLFATILPSMIAGGFLLGSSPGHAESGREGAARLAPVSPESEEDPVLFAQADPWAPPRHRSPRGPLPPVPPTPPDPAVPPPPPLPPPHAHGHGMSISIDGNKIELDGIAEMVQNQLDRVADALDNVPDVPPDVRARVKGRVDAVRGTLRARLGKLRSLDLDQLGPEMERMGDEIEREMKGLDKDLEQFGDKFGKHFAEKFGKRFAEKFARGFGPDPVPAARDRDNSDGDDDADDDDDDRGATALPPTAEADEPDLRDAVAGLRGLTLDQSQRDQLTRLRAETDRKVSEARRELEDMSNRLHDTLEDLGASEADIERQIEQISQKEAAIRKARILAWVKARSLLDKDQRRKVEAAARRHH